MGWLQDIFKNNRRLEEIEVEELKLLQEKSEELRTLVVKIPGIIETAVRDKKEKEKAKESRRKPINVLLPSHNQELMNIIRLIEKNLKEEIELTMNIEKIEKKRGE